MRWNSESIALPTATRLGEEPVPELLRQGGDEAADANKDWATAIIQWHCPSVYHDKMLSAMRE